MKYRYLVEVSGDPHRPYALTTITKDDTDGRGHKVASVDDAKATAAGDPNLDTPIRWRDAPADWQPDALFVSQWIDDGVEDDVS